jgi:hypothetical protein
MPETKIPSKKWRVRPYGGENTAFRSQRAAYDTLPAINAFGKTAVIEHWENGRWVLYERISPDGLPA